MINWQTNKMRIFKLVYSLPLYQQKICTLSKTQNMLSTIWFLLPSKKSCIKPCSGSGLVPFVSLWSVGMPEICLQGGLGKSICINSSPPYLITMVVSPILLYWWINTRVICMLVTLIAGCSKAVLAAVLLCRYSASFRNSIPMYI